MRVKSNSDWSDSEKAIAAAKLMAEQFGVRLLLIKVEDAEGVSTFRVKPKAKP